MRSDPQISEVFLDEWRRLWAVAEEAAMVAGESPETVFEPIGLMLQAPGPGAAHYDATPADGVTFAHTGADGVHFSAVGERESITIVMTVPMEFVSPNHVVGTSLHDFLCLGCRTGYFALEQLAYDRNWTLDWLAAAEPDSEVDQQQLDFLCERLQLRPRPDISHRLAELASLLSP